MTITKRVTVGAAEDTTKRVSMSGGTPTASTSFTADTWGGTWGGTWGFDWWGAVSTTTLINPKPEADNTNRVVAAAAEDSTQRVNANALGTHYDAWDGAWGTSWATSWFPKAAVGTGLNTARVSGAVTTNITKRVP